MATQTPNIGLTKQAQNEYNHNPVLNSNWDIVDSKMGQVPAGKSVQEQIGDLSDLTTTDKSSLVGAANELNSNIANKPDKKSVGLSANQSFTLTLESGHAYLITMMTTSADSQIVQMISKIGSDVKKAVLSQGSYSSYFTESLTASAWTFTNGSYASYVNVIDF